jgi:hypothetical protein
VTINSVAITRNASRNTAAQTVRIPSSTVSGSVQLIVKASNYTNKTVSGGIPLPEGAIASTTEMMLKTDQGVEVPAQFDIIANWPDGTIKSVLVTAAISGNATTEVNYYLDYGAAVAQSTYSTNLGYTEDSNEIVVSTGKVRVTLDKNTGALIKSAYADTAGDQTYATQVLAASNIWLQNAFDDVMFYASNDTALTWTVKRSGPIMLTLQAVGHLKDSGGNDLTEFRCWFTFYRDSDVIDFDYTLVDDNDTDNPQTFDFGSDTVRFAAKNYGVELNHSIASNHQYIFGGETFHETGSFTTQQYLYQTGTLTFINGVCTATPGATAEDGTGQTFTYNGIQQGEKAPGFFSVHNGTVGCSVIVRQFWEQWPNELSVDTSKMQIHLHPDRYNGGTATTTYSLGPNGEFIRPNTLYNQKRGVAKTTKMKIVIHSATPVADDLKIMADDFNEFKIGFECTADHYCNSGVFGSIIPSDNDSNIHDSSIYQNVLIVSQTNRLSDKMRPHGWRDFGDVYRQGSTAAGSLGTQGPQVKCGAHVGATNFYLMWVRTGERDWLKEAELETFHFRDIDITHGTVSSNYFTGSVLDPEPAGGITFAGHGMIDHESRRSYETHYHMSGLLENHYLSGDLRTLEVVEEVKAYLAHMTIGWYFTPRPTWGNYGYGYGFRKFATAEREFAWPLYCMNVCTKVTNDPDYHATTAGQLIKFMIEWWKDIGTHSINGVQIGINDYTVGTGWWRMDDMDNGVGTGCNPWMAAWMFHTILDWLDLEAKYQSGVVDVVEVRQMVYQCVEYVVKYGYDTVNNDFWYSESQKRNGDAGADKHMGAAVARAYVLLNQDIIDGNISNPEWFDLAAWRVPASYYYNQAKTETKGFYPPGFYGYEILWPSDSWVYFKDYDTLINS